MHIVESSGVSFWVDGCKLNAKTKYLIEDVNMHIFTGVQENAVKKCTFWDNPKPFDASQDWNGKSILIIRAGGHGDILFLTPSLRELKKRFPNVTLAVSAKSQYWESLEQTELCDELYEYPIRMEFVDTFDAVIPLENALEAGDGYKANAIDFFAQKIGIELTDKTTQFDLTPEEIAWAQRDIAKRTKWRIGIQPVSTTPVRTYPVQLLSDAMSVFLQSPDFEVLSFGTPNTYKMNFPPNAKYFDLSTAFFTFREAVAVINTCDVFIGQDSGLTHASLALKKPTICLYAAYPAENRVKYQPSAHVLEGKLPCAPCYTKGNTFPAHQPCAKSGRCEALAQIPPYAIVQKVLEICK